MEYIILDIRSILSSRLSRYAEEEGLIAEEQGGFRRERSAVDQVFTLTEVIRSRKGKTYVCFIDLDMIWREGLWRVLWDMGG